MNASPSIELLSSLRATGLYLTTSGDGVINVGPRERVTDQVRSRIRENKPGLLMILERELTEYAALQGRIRAMGERWRYSDEDLAWAMEDARRNPSGWRTCCDADEASADLRRRAGMPFLPADQGRVQTSALASSD
jgi:hypothetical protein